MIKKIKKWFYEVYAKPAQSVRDYWRAYGGWSDFASSAYTITSVAFALATTPAIINKAWWNLPITILPNIVGFSIGAYAILVSFGDEKFRKKLASDSDESSEKNLRIYGNILRPHQVHLCR